MQLTMNSEYRCVLFPLNEYRLIKAKHVGQLQVTLKKIYLRSDRLFNNVTQMEISINPHR